MEFEQILKKRVRGMAVRILANIEHALGITDLEGVTDKEQFTLTGAVLRVIRGEVLNAAGDTTRSLSSEVSTSKPGRLSFSREVIGALNEATVDIDDAMNLPILRISGDFYLLDKIRKEVGAGVVYNKMYTCVGLNDVIDRLIPFLDTAQIAGIKIADGDYRSWRDAVCELYLEGLGDE